MTGYVIVVSPDATLGYKADTYATNDDKLIAVVAMLNNPTPNPQPLKQVRVVVSGLRMRGGANTNAFIIRDCAVNEVFTVYETSTDAAGYIWVRVGDNQWICRYIPGGNPADKAVFI